MKISVKQSAFEIKEHLGGGNFGSVHKGEIAGLCDSNAKTTIAVKTVKNPESETEVKDFLYEIKIMGYIKPHLNLVSMIGSCTTDVKKNAEK